MNQRKTHVLANVATKASLRVWRVNGNVSMAVSVRLLVEADAGGLKVLLKGIEDESYYCSHFDRGFGLDQPVRVFRDGQVLDQTRNENRHAGWHDDDHDRTGSQEDRRTSTGRDTVNSERASGRSSRPLDGPNASLTKGFQSWRIQH